MLHPVFDVGTHILALPNLPCRWCDQQRIQSVFQWPLAGLALPAVREIVCAGRTDICTVQGTAHAKVREGVGDDPVFVRGICVMAATEEADVFAISNGLAGGGQVECVCGYAHGAFVAKRRL